MPIKFPGPTPDCFPIQTPPGPCTVPLPYPNFSSVSTPLGFASRVVLPEAQAQGFSRAGAEQVFLENKIPSAMPDLLILSRLTSASLSSLPQESRSRLAQETGTLPLAPTQSRVIVNCMTQAKATSSAAPPPATAPAASPASSSPAPASGPKK